MTGSTTARLLGSARDIFPGATPGNLVWRARFLSAGLRERALAGQMLHAPEGSALQRILRERPQTMGVLIWPYQCASWDRPERLRRVLGHYAVVDRLGAPFGFSTEERLVLADLGEVHEGLMIVLDQPKWFLREGGFAINLFVGNFRAFSIAFSLCDAADGRRTATIGGLQGRRRDDILDLYREMTKTMFGLRPRDLLIEAFRILCRYMKVDDLKAVAEASRFQNHPYFRKKPKLSQNYDEVWEDRGGVRSSPDFYDIPIAPDRRDLSDVKPNKRPMYRRRFEFIDELETRMMRDIPDLKPVQFVDL